MVMPGHLVGFGGMVGAVLRHIVSEAVARETFPVGTLTVNVVGSFVLGIVTFLGADSDVLLFVGTGACGSFTTFSSFSHDTVGLWEDGKQYKAVTFAFANIVGAVFAIGLAWFVAL
ncbi:fluoride efflux transporter CrcB [Halomicrococcus sp. NG-SE-24]|uniref:fluoride efflux transporter CrcB n=1 Tax=Halomicrococcus sp. NG-SE-24 TaxID=3436928 RepID=UPI003D95ECB7